MSAIKDELIEAVEIITANADRIRSLTANAEAGDINAIVGIITANKRMANGIARLDALASPTEIAA